MPEFLRRHVWFLPAIGGNNPFVCLCGVVYDIMDGFKLATFAEADHEIEPSSFILDACHALLPGVPFSYVFLTAILKNRAFNLQK
jgi:hypothetical protein